ASIASGDGLCARATPVDSKSNAPRTANDLYMACSLESRDAGLRSRVRLFSEPGVDEQIRNLVREVERSRDRRHDRKAGKGDDDLLEPAVAVLDQYPVRAKGQEHAETEQR